MAVKISIITPSYNQAEYLEQTILSVLGQNYGNLEYIIIDGGSTDNSVEIIKKYEKQLHYWVSERDSGQSAAINKGIQQASGEIIAWLNSDDLYCENTLHIVSDLFEKNSEVDIVYGDVINFDTKGKETRITNQFEINDFFSRVSIHQPGVFWRRSLHAEFGLIDEKLFYCMDYDLWMPLFLNCKSMRTEKVLARFREHGHSKTGSKPIGLYNEYALVVSRFFNSLSENTWSKKLTASGINYDKETKRYKLNEKYNESILSKIFWNYLQNCVETEYTKGDFLGVNRLFILNPHLLFHTKGLLIFLKTNSLFIFLRNKN
ncbi:glycosyltransferase family 2 protein [Aurantibacillus circumpalustris]|uniref:glycosyltransferase family 2 protein n=1 Tax=Aurantibacillus circumpalustris TaxID=3036359 RepID=UPI00295B5530|nr:glycosyltransferase family 2 protein [Aurantibacillus circumpalustris]